MAFTTANSKLADIFNQVVSAHCSDDKEKLSTNACSELPVLSAMTRWYMKTKNLYYFLSMPRANPLIKC